MRTLIAAAILAAAFAASPAQASGGSHTESCGQSVITVGDPITKVRSACGEPWRIVQLENVFGAGVGERWESVRLQMLERMPIAAVPLERHARGGRGPSLLRGPATLRAVQQFNVGYASCSASSRTGMFAHFPGAT